MAYKVLNVEIIGFVKIWRKKNVGITFAIYQKKVEKQFYALICFPINGILGFKDQSKLYGFMKTVQRVTGVAYSASSCGLLILNRGYSLSGAYMV